MLNLMIVLAAMPVGAPPAGFSCEISAVTCGEITGTSFETGICGVAELGKIGAISNRVYTEVTIFVGYRFGADILFVGSNGKGGLRVTCKVPVTGGKPNLKQLKKELPELLLRDKKIRARYPSLQRADLDRSFRFQSLSKEQRKRIESSFTAK